jgi:hypothetical protein
MSKRLRKLGVPTQGSDICERSSDKVIGTGGVGWALEKEQGTSF